MLGFLAWPWIEPRRDLSNIHEFGLGRDGGVDGRDRSMGCGCWSSDVIGQSGPDRKREDMPGRGAAMERHDRASNIMNLGNNMLSLCDKWVVMV